MSAVPVKFSGLRLEVILEPGATRLQVENRCREAKRLSLYGVCVHSSRVELARTLLDESPVKVVGLVDYPAGAAEGDVKRFEVETAVDLGAQELLVVLNSTRIKDGEGQVFLRELRDVVEAADERPVTGLLDVDSLVAEEAKTACELVLDSGIHGLCVRVGSTGAPAPEVVRGLRTVLGAKFVLKALCTGQVLHAADALSEAGVDRFVAREEVFSALSPQSNGG